MFCTRTFAHGLPKKMTCYSPCFEYEIPKEGFEIQN